MTGTTVLLSTDVIEGYDDFGAPIYREEYEEIEDCLVGSPSTDDITSALNLYGKKVEYIIGIPKGDTHEWNDKTVIIWGEKYRTFGFPITGELSNIPLRWGQNIRVERYG